MNELSFNDLLQWIAVGIIMVIVVATIVRKTVRFRRQIKSDDNTPGCGCGCSSCPSLNKSCKGPDDKTVRKDRVNGK